MTTPVLPPALVDTLRGPSSAPPPPARPCVAPPPDDRLELLRAWLLRSYRRVLPFSARHLLGVATLSDAAAWAAVERDLDDAPDTGTSRRVAAALAMGRLDEAVGHAARIVGEPVETWLADERAKGGAR